jgi:hypothetical protein
MFKLMPFAKAAVITGISLLGIGLSVNAQAGKWQQEHPRRAEVNHRLDNQNRRINHELKEGEITKQQARQLHHEDHQIRREERQMAAQHGGHITKQEQRALNQQENAVSRQIGR